MIVWQRDGESDADDDEDEVGGKKEGDQQVCGK